MPRLKLDPLSPSGISTVQDQPLVPYRNQGHGMIAGAKRLQDLSDVSAVLNPTNGQVLVWNATTGKYEPGTPSGGGTGGGDMYKSTYDTNNNGIVDNSEKLANQIASYYLDRTNHTGTQSESTVTNLTTDLAARLQVGGDIGGTPTAPYILGTSGTLINYVVNPSFEVDYFGWTTYGGFGTITRDTTSPFSGTYTSLHTNASPSDGGLQSTAISLVAGQTYYLSVYARISSSVTNAHVVLRTITGFNVKVQLNLAYPGNTNMNRYSGTFTMTTSETVHILLGQGSYGPPPYKYRYGSF